MPVDVRPDHLAIILKTLKRFVPAYRVVAFGSRVIGTAKNTSDLDLCIISDKNISFEILANIRDEFSLSNIPYKIDVIDWSVITPDFRKIVLENCYEIQAANNSTIT